MAKPLLIYIASFYGGFSVFLPNLEISFQSGIFSSFDSRMAKYPIEIIGCHRFESGSIESKKFFAGCKFVMYRRPSRFIPRATLLAGIASIYPIAHSIGYERSYIPLVLDGLTRDTQAGIHTPRSVQRPGGTTVHTTRTIAASSNDRTIGRKIQRSYQFSQEEERAFTGNNQLGIFPDKAETCTNRPITFPHRSRIATDPPVSPE